MKVALTPKATGLFFSPTRFPEVPQAYFRALAVVSHLIFSKDIFPVFKFTGLTLTFAHRFWLISVSIDHLGFTSKTRIETFGEESRSLRTIIANKRNYA